MKGLPPILAGLFIAGILWNASYAAKTTMLDMQNVPEDMQPLVDELHPKHGTFIIGEGLATLATPKGFSYLPADQTDILLNQVIGFTGKTTSLGSLVPDKVQLGSPATWAAVITYRSDGHLPTDSLAAADPAYLLEELTRQTNEHNTKISQMGLHGVGTELIGWASKPFYDKKSHSFYWGLETEERPSKLHMITYFIHIPGRRGIIVITISADFQLLPMLKDSLKPLLSSITFNAQDRYEDFDVKRDRQAFYTATDAILGHQYIQRKSEASSPPAAEPPVPNRVRGIVFIGLLVIALMAIRIKRRKKP